MILTIKDLNDQNIIVDKVEDFPIRVVYAHRKNDKYSGLGPGMSKNKILIDGKYYIIKHFSIDESTSNNTPSNEIDFTHSSICVL